MNTLQRYDFFKIKKDGVPSSNSEEFMRKSPCLSAMATFSLYDPHAVLMISMAGSVAAKIQHFSQLAVNLEKLLESRKI